MKNILLIGIFLGLSTLMCGETKSAQKDFKGLKRKLDIKFEVRLNSANKNEYSRIIKNKRIGFSYSFDGEEEVIEYKKNKLESKEHVFVDTGLYEKFYSMNDLLKLSREEIVAKVELKWDGCKNRKHCKESDYIRLPKDGINLRIKCNTIGRSKAHSDRYVSCNPYNSFFMKDIKVDHESITLKSNDSSGFYKNIKFRLDDDAIESIRIAYGASDDSKEFYFGLNCFLVAEYDSDLELLREIFKINDDEFSAYTLQYKFIDRDQIDVLPLEKLRVETSVVSYYDGFLPYTGKKYVLRANVKKSYILLDNESVDYESVMNEKVRKALLSEF